MRVSSLYFSRKMASDFLHQQSELAITQTQLSSGKKINRPSDDPAVAGINSNLKQVSSQLQQFQRNSTFAESRLALEEASLASISNILLRMKELSLAINNDTHTDKDNGAYLAEVEQQRLELIDYANTRDGNGDFLFAGNAVNRKPFVGSKTIQYLGDDEIKSIQIGSTRTIAAGDSGADIFLRIRNGNGSLTVGSSSGNSGSGIISPAHVVDNSVFEKHNIRVEFTSATAFNVIDDTSGSTLLSAQPYTPSDDIQVAGVEFSISGTPAAGDQFAVEPSKHQDLFSTVNKFVGILKLNPLNEAEEAQRRQDINGLISDLDQAFEHINTKRSQVGARQAYILRSRDENESIKFRIDTTVSRFEDLDYAEAVTRMQAQLTTLQALQSSFSRIESLSLFDYL